jgi:hypothetical protein
MTRKDLGALADALRRHNQTADGRTEFTPDHLLLLANFCASQYPNLNRKRWIDYIAGVGRPRDELMFEESDGTGIRARIAVGVGRGQGAPRCPRGG